MSEERVLFEDTKEITKDANTLIKINKTERSLYIGRVKQSERNVFEQLVDNSNKETHKQLFMAMLNTYQSLRPEFDNVERAIMQEARELAPKNFDKSIKRAVLRYAKNIIEQKNKPPRPVDTKLKNSAKSADARADALLEEIFKNNNEAVHWYDKIFLTKSSILDYSKKQRSSDPTNIAMGKVVLDRALERYEERIRRHHEEHKLTDNHNIVAHYERLKVEKEQGKL
jgi:hypothetical protein